MRPITSYAELQQLAATLAAPPGKTLVFRGQTTKEDALLATGKRSGGTYEPPWVWFAYATLLARRFKLAALRAGGADRTKAHIVDREAQFLLSYGMDAFSQHYGPNSRFLDVTRNLDIALWFALHRAEAADLVSVPQDFAQLIHDRDAINVYRTTSYAPVQEGWLLALHAPTPERPGKLEHGALVDLLSDDTPGFIKVGTRLKAQAACLVDGEDGDLSPFLACPPIPIARPLAGAPLIDAALHVIFPPPEDDPWYATLLALPRAPCYAPETRKIRRKQPIEVTVYRDAHADAHAGDLGRMRDNHRIGGNDALYGLSLDPAEYPPDLPGEARERFRLARIQDAPVLLLEAPVVALHPSLPHWNLQALFSSLSDQAFVLDHEKHWPTAAVGLHNILIELSPLEYAYWDAPQDADASAMRGIWIVREGDFYALVVFYDSEDGGGALLWEGPLYIRFNRAIAAPELYDNGVWSLVDKDDRYSEALVAAVDLLRNVSPGQRRHAIDNALAIGTFEAPSGYTEIGLPARPLSRLSGRLRVHGRAQRQHQRPVCSPAISLQLRRRQRHETLRRSQSCAQSAPRAHLPGGEGDRSAGNPRESAQGRT